MSENKKAAPVVETGSGEEEQLSLPGFASSEKKNTTSAVQAQGRISSLLLRGEENAVPLHQLAAWTGWDEREVRRMIQRERLAGIPILSNNATGYYLPAGDAERARFVRSMRARARQILRAAKAVEQGGIGGEPTEQD